MADAETHEVITELRQLALEVGNSGNVNGQEPWVFRALTQAADLLESHAEAAR